MKQISVNFTVKRRNMQFDSSMVMGRFLSDKAHKIPKVFQDILRKFEPIQKVIVEKRPKTTLYHVFTKNYKATFDGVLYEALKNPVPEMKGVEFDEEMGLGGNAKPLVIKKRDYTYLIGPIVEN